MKSKQLQVQASPAIYTILLNRQLVQCSAHLGQGADKHVAHDVKAEAVDLGSRVCKEWRCRVGD